MSAISVPYTFDAFTLIQSAQVNANFQALVTAANGAPNNLAFGAGAPSTLVNEGATYYNTSTTPYTQYVQHSGAWEATGQAVSGALLASNNLSDVASASAALSNLAGAPLHSPTFTGTPSAPTPSTSDSSTKLATTAYVKANGAPTATASSLGLVQPDGSSITISAGVISAAGYPSLSNNSLLANTSGGTGVATGTTLTALLDSIFGTTQGAVLYRGASVWSELAPGTAGQILQTGGASANPSWTSNGIVTFGSGAPSTLVGDGVLYFDTANSYRLYVQHSGAWQAATV